MSFTEFYNLMIGEPLLLVAVILTLAVILVNGWTDAPNAIATCVSTRCMSVRSAIIMAAIFNFLGVFIMTQINASVAETITKMVKFGDDDRIAVIAISAAMFAIVIWATLAWVFGIPTSESHALIAGLTGSAVASYGNFDAVVGSEWVNVLIGIVISIVLGFALGYGVCKLVILIFRKIERRKTEGFFRGAQITGAASMAFMHGAQDGQKFMAVILLCTYLGSGSGTPDVIAPPTWLMLLCSGVMALGTAIGGKKIIKSVGMDMVKLEKYQGFSADIAAASSLLVCSVFSLPVSTTHVKTTSIMGVGAVKRLSAINLGVVKEMALTWILTFPGCGIIGFLMTKLFILIFN